MTHEKRVNVKWSDVTQANFTKFLSPTDNGFAVVTGDKFLVLDFDLKDSPPMGIYDLLDVNCSAVERTPGGYHFWYLTDARTTHFRSSSGIVWDNVPTKGLDIRAKKGICYTHPSHYTGKDGQQKTYRWIRGNLGTATPLPTVVLEHLSFDETVFLERESLPSTITISHRTEDPGPSSSLSVVEAQDDIVTVLLGLAPHRVESYQSWLSVGMALKGSGYSCELWDEWSRTSPKYMPGCCERKWRTFRDTETPLTKATLYHWLKTDNHALFVTLQGGNKDIVMALTVGTHAHIADAFYWMNPDRYVYSDSGGWYILQDNHTWLATGSTEVGKIPSIYNAIRYDCCDVLYEVMKRLPRGQEEDTAKNRGMADTLKKVCSSSFTRGVLPYLSGLYGRKDVEKLFNQKRHLFAFTNGVYDMNEMEFRAIQPSDYITVTCGYDYREPSGKEKEQALDFMKSIVPNEGVLRYMLQALSTTLEGENRGETFHALTGMGANGKSCLMDLCKVTFGDYFRTIGVSYLTKDDDGKDRPLPDLVAAQWSRMLVASEPEEGDTLQVALLKIITGNDEVSCRGMYGKLVTKFVPQFKLWIMTNDMPRLSKHDQGIERRMRCVHFPTRFVAQPRAENERVRDDGLKGRIRSEEGWRYGFMGLLLDAFKEGRGRSLEMPEEVRTTTEEYMLKNNPVGAWLRREYELTGHREDCVKKTDLYDAFRESGGDKTRPRFYEDVLKCSVQEIKLHGERIFIGLRKREKQLEEE